LNAYEARLLGVERQLMMIGRRANTLERETWAGLQDALELWGEVPPAAAPCSGSIDVTVTYAGSPVVGATVTLSGAGSGSGTTDSSGFVSIPITVAGSYTVTMSALGCLASASTTVTATCAVNPVSLTPATPTNRSRIAFAVKGCNSLGLSGSTVTATKSGVTYSGTTDGSGNATLDVSASGAGTYTLTASDPSGGRFVAFSGSVAVTCTASAVSVGVTLTPATGYHCASPITVGFRCVLPIKDTLTLTTNLGGVTLTWNGSEWAAVQNVGGVTAVTAGCTAGSPPTCNGPGVAGQTVVVNWHFAGSMGLTNTYGTCRFGGSTTLPVSGTLTACTTTSGDSSTTSSVVCPTSFLVSGTANAGSHVGWTGSWTITE
jgi:hypothetical protein